MLSVKLDTGFNIEVNFPISPFHRRMFAWALDVLLMLLYYYLTSMIINAFTGNRTNGRDWILVLLGIPVLIYYPAMEILTNGQT
ncbi:MAG: RDD family protein, partial [Bacteroidota bacterium]|nr:RDD family protein [Bacteroidota bacterium]